MHQNEKTYFENVYEEIVSYSKSKGWNELDPVEHVDSETIVITFKKLFDELQKRKKELEESSLMLESNLEEISNTYDLLSTLLEITNTLSKDINPFNTAMGIVNILQQNIQAEEFSLFLFDEEKIVEFSESESQCTKKFLDSYLSTSKNVVMDDHIPLMAIPIKIENDLDGVFICIGKKNNTFFSAADRKLVEATSKQLKLALSNYNYFKREIKRVVFEREMSIAKEIQERFFPTKFPEKYKVAGVSIPAHDVGGDYYDAFERNGKLFLTIADVSGKGIGAALMMSMFRSYLRSISTYGNLHEMATYLNRLMCEELSEDKFVTAVVGTFDPASCNFEYVNAGHDPIVIIKDKKAQFLESDNPPFGILENDNFYIPKSVKLSNDDLIFLYTDGLPEARNVNNEEYGFDRLFKKIISISEKAPSKIIHEIIDDIDDFSKGADQHDDMTVLVTKTEVS